MDRNRLHPKKLQRSKWTAVAPVGREKHFLVTAVVEPEREGAAVEFVELEAVLTRRTRRIAWRELTDPQRWRQGWL